MLWTVTQKHRVYKRLQYRILWRCFVAVVTFWLNVFCKKKHLSLGDKFIISDNLCRIIWFWVKIYSCDIQQMIIELFFCFHPLNDNFSHIFFDIKYLQLLSYNSTEGCNSRQLIDLDIKLLGRCDLDTIFTV